jgi:hypothetical protein
MAMVAAEGKERVYGRRSGNAHEEHRERVKIVFVIDMAVRPFLGKRGLDCSASGGRFGTERPFAFSCWIGNNFFPSLTGVAGKAHGPGMLYVHH